MDLFTWWLIIEAFLHLFIGLSKERCTVWELTVKFYLGQNEDSSPGDCSTSDSSKRLPQEEVGEVQHIRFWWKGEFSAIKHLFCKRFSASHEKLMSWLEAIWRDARIGVMKSFLKISTWRSVPSVFLEDRVPGSPPWIPLSGCWRSVVAAAEGSVSAEAEGECSRCCSLAGKCSGQMPICSWHSTYSLQPNY